MELGVCVGNVNKNLAVLHAKYAFGTNSISLSPSVWESLPDGMLYVPCTFEVMLSENDCKKIVACSKYSGDWIIGSEPRTAWDNNNPADVVAKRFDYQIANIKKVDPNAKIIITCSTQGQLPNNPHSNQNFIGDLWGFLSEYSKANTDGLHCHIYPRWISDDDSIRWNVKFFNQYLRQIRAWMNQNGLSGKELWVTETGFEGFFGDDPFEYEKCVDYLGRLLDNKYTNTLDRLFFYPANNGYGAGGTNGYLPLLDDNGLLTGLGSVFRAKATP